MRRLLRPLHHWIWRDPERRARKLLRFAETEANGGRDLVRAAEVTPDPLLRRLYLLHAADEQHHAHLFRQRGAALLRTLPLRSRSGVELHWLAPGERGLDDLRIEDDTDDALLAFLHLSEKAAAVRFAGYRDALQDDPSTRAVFDRVLHDETFHMNYTLSQLARVSPRRYRLLLWRARLGRLRKGYLRLASALAGLASALVLTILYFLLLPPFALLAKHAQRKEPLGWIPISPERSRLLERQY
jgi:rubrerythrin